MSHVTLALISGFWMITWISTLSLVCEKPCYITKEWWAMDCLRTKHKSKAKLWKNEVLNQSFWILFYFILLALPGRCNSRYSQSTSTLNLLIINLLMINYLFCTNYIISIFTWNKVLSGTVIISAYFVFLTQKESNQNKFPKNVLYKENVTAKLMLYIKVHWRLNNIADYFFVI